MNKLACRKIERMKKAQINKGDNTNVQTDGVNIFKTFL